GNQLGIGFRTPDFFDVDVHGHTEKTLQVALEVFNVFTTTADDNTGTRGVDGDAGVLGRPFDDDLAHCSVLQLFLEVFTYLYVVAEHAGKCLFGGIPAGCPVAIDCQTEPDRVYFLSHCCSLGTDLDHNVAGLLFNAVATALGTRFEPLERLCLVDVDGRDPEFVDIGAIVVLGIGQRGLQRLLDEAGSLFWREGKNVERLLNGLAANQVGNQSCLLSRDGYAANNSLSFHGLPPRLLVCHMTLESAGQGKFAKLVADHVLVDVDGNMLTAVVHGDGQPDEFGQDG